MGKSPYSDVPKIPSPHLNNGRDRGIACENRVFTAIRRRYKLWPKNVKSIRKANHEQDKLGIDMIIYLLDGPAIYVQIKSCRKEAQRFRKSHPDIDVIIGSKHESEIFLRFMDIVKHREDKNE